MPSSPPFSRNQTQHRDTNTPQKDEVFIGLPCYNRPDGLQVTIDTIRAQTHQNWKLLICDNASPDPAVGEISMRAQESDERIEYFRHPANLGMTENFRFAANRADRPLFMWASDDDVWHPDFIQRNIHTLENHPDHHLAFGAVQIINRSGAPIFSHPTFSRLHGMGDLEVNLRRYLDEPEKLGKANLMYSLFRTDALQATVRECWDDAFAEFYGCDYVFLFAFFCRFQAAIHDEVHLQKRQPTDAKRKLFWRHPRSYRVTKARHLESYIQRYRQVAPTAEVAEVAERMLRTRQRERLIYLMPPLANWWADGRRAA